jgi:hypothetical protein
MANQQPNQNDMNKNKTPSSDAARKEQQRPGQGQAGSQSGSTGSDKKSSNY